MKQITKPMEVARTKVSMKGALGEILSHIQPPRGGDAAEAMPETRLTVADLL